MKYTFLHTKYRHNVPLMEKIKNTQKILTEYQMKEPAL